jgi:hypothetical protein
LRRLISARASRARTKLRFWCSTKCVEQVSDYLARGTVGGNKLGVVPTLRPHLPQSQLLLLCRRGLGREPTEQDLPGGVEPMAGQRVDDLGPDAPLDRVEVRRRLRATLSGDAGDDGERGGGFARHRKAPLQIECCSVA